jgi:phage I-like protein
MFQTALCQSVALPIPAEGDAPEWLHLLPAGEIRTYDGRGPYRAPDPTELLLQSLNEAGGRLPLDENHSTDLAAPKGGPSPARGWITELESRADGIWGRASWTREGRRLVAEGEYRHLSPVIAHDAKGRVTRILRASLTNRPNLRGLTSLHHEGADMELLEKLRAELGLPDDSGEADALAAVKALKTSVSTHAVQMAAVAKAVGAAEDAELTVVLQHVEDLNDPAKFVPVAEVVALQSQLAESASQIEELRTAGAREKAEAAVDAAIAAGKAGVKPLRDHFIARHMKEPDVVATELAALPSLTGKSGASAEPPKDKGKTGDLSEAGARVVQLMGIDPEKYRATQAAVAVVEEAL